MEKTDFVYPQINMIQTGELLRRLSRQKGFSVKEIQSALGLASNQAVYDWFNGKTLPTLNNLFALSRLFGLSMESMIVSDTDTDANDFVRNRNLSELEVNSLIRIQEYRKRLKVCA